VKATTKLNSIGCEYIDEQSQRRVKNPFSDFPGSILKTRFDGFLDYVRSNL